MPAEIARKQIQKAKDYLEKGMPDVAIAFFLGLPEVEEAGLGELVWLLDHSYYNCTKGDVQGVIELLEKFLNEKENPSSKS